MGPEHHLQKEERGYHMRLISIGAVALALSACQFAGTGIELRERVLDRMVGEYCGASEAGKIVLISTREWSPEFVTYLESRCEE